MLLAAITAADPALQTAAESATGQTQGAVPPQAANDDVSDASDLADAASDCDANALRPPTVSEAAPSKSTGNPNKKAEPDKNSIGASTDPSTLQTQILAMQSAPQAPQAAVQTQTVANDDSEQDISAIGDPHGGSAPVTPPGSGSRATPAQPAIAANGTQKPATPAIPATPAAPAAPRAIAASQDDDDDDTDVEEPNSAAAFGQAMAASHMHAAARSNPLPTTEERPAASEPAAAATPPASAPVDNDTDTAPPESQALVANVTPPTNAQPQSDPVIDAAIATPPKADVKPANKSAQTFQADATSQGDAPAKTSIQASGADAAVATAGPDNSKPAHALPPQAQSDGPQAMPQASPHAIANAASESAVAINLGSGSNIQSGLTLPVHVTNHDFSDQTSTPTTAPNTDALAVSIAARLVGGAKQFDIRLDPPELGRVEVRLSIDASGKTQAHLTADQPQTVALLQKDAPNLTRALRDAGLDVSQNGLNFSLKGQGQNQGGHSGNFGTPSRSMALPAVAQSVDAAPSSATLPSSLLGRARLDIHV